MFKACYFSLICLLLLSNCRGTQPSAPNPEGKGNAPKDVVEQTDSVTGEEENDPASGTTQDWSPVERLEDGSLPTARRTDPDTVRVANASSSEEQKAEGSGVNNGAGPTGKAIACSDETEGGWTFSAHHTAAVGLLQGVLKKGDRIIVLYCRSDVPEDAGYRLGPPWICRQIPDDPPFTAKISADGLTGSFTGLDLQLTLSCKK